MKPEDFGVQVRVANFRFHQPTYSFKLGFIFSFSFNQFQFQFWSILVSVPVSDSVSILVSFSFSFSQFQFQLPSLGFLRLAPEAREPGTGGGGTGGRVEQ